MRARQDSRNPQVPLLVLANHDRRDRNVFGRAHGADLHFRLSLRQTPLAQLVLVHAQLLPDILRVDHFARSCAPRSGTIFPLLFPGTVRAVRVGHSRVVESQESENSRPQSRVASIGYNKEEFLSPPVNFFSVYRGDQLGVFKTDQFQLQVWSVGANRVSATQLIRVPPFHPVVCTK
jgi:hypothetical protein